MRPNNRKSDELRAISLETNFNPYAEGSCLVKCGNTHVLCTVTVEDGVPPFLRNTGKGWVTAEYGMLPRSTHTRSSREAAKGKQSGRTQEIQRLIGRSLRAVVDLKLMGERQIVVDCDVIQADGGTRTASISGGYVALALAFKKMGLKQSPLTDSIAAISCGILDGGAILDLEYVEDSAADADANFVLTGKGNIVEIQATAEGKVFKQEQFDHLLLLARKGIAELTELQKAAIANA